MIEAPFSRSAPSEDPANWESLPNRSQALRFMARANRQRGETLLLEWTVNRIKLLNALFAYFECDDATLRCHKQYHAPSPASHWGFICILIVQTEAAECSLRSLNEVINVIDNLRGAANCNRIWSMASSDCDSFPIAKRQTPERQWLSLLYDLRCASVSTRYNILAGRST